MMSYELDATAKKITGVKLLSADQSDLIYELRKEAYLREYGEQARIEALRPTEFESEFQNLGAFKSGQLVSVLRISLVNNQEYYYRIMLAEFEPEELTLPLVILGRAATRQGYEARGLHTLLRYHAFHWAKRSGVKWIVGTFKSDTKRMTQLAKMGYQFSLNPKKWDGVLNAERPAIVARVDIGKNFDRAKSVMQSTYERLNSEFPVLSEY